MNDFNLDGTPPPFPWLSAAVAAFALVAYPVLIVGLCAGWW